MSDHIFSREWNLGFVFVPLGVVGLVSIFVYLVTLVNRKEGIPTNTLVFLCIAFLISVLFTVLGSQVKVISSLSSGEADGENK